MEAWFQARLRYHVHIVPTSSSWLNLIERWFAEITRKRIRRETFKSVPALEKAIHDYILAYNKEPRPFVWTATASRILGKIRRCKEELERGDYGERLAARGDGARRLRRAGRGLDSGGVR